MPRFSIKILFTVIAVISLWLSTATGYRAASAIQSVVILGILVASGVAAVSYDGCHRAFWGGFFITVLLVGINGKLDVGQGWITHLLNSYGVYQNLPSGFANNWFMFLNATMQAATMLLTATVMGIVGVLVCQHCERAKKQQQ